MKSIPAVSDLARRQCKVPAPSKSTFYRSLFASKKPQALFEEAALSAAAPKDMLSLERAGQKIRRAISSGLDSSEAYSSLALIYLQMCKIPEAVVIAEHLSGKGFDAQANFIAGMAFLSMARMNKSEADAIFASDSSGKAYVSVTMDGQVKRVAVDKQTRLLNMAGTIKAQLAAALECFEASGKAPIVLFNTAFAYQLLSQQEQAIEKYQEILNLPASGLSDKMLSSLYNNIGVCHYKQFQTELAEKAFNESIKYNSIAAARANLETIGNDDMDRRARADSLRLADLYYDPLTRAHQ